MQQTREQEEQWAHLILDIGESEVLHDSVDLGSARGQRDDMHDFM